MAKVHELPDDLDQLGLDDEGMNADVEPDIDLDSMLPSGIPGSGTQDVSQAISGASMPPSMQRHREFTADELLAEMNRMPLFMTSLDDIDGADGDNTDLEAIKALAYEGTRAEVAGNFRQQGNDLAKVKRWSDAREFYSRALAALKIPLKPQDAIKDMPDQDVVDLDRKGERKKEREMEEASYANRALCNLEMKNYGSCKRDCAAALNINPKNAKAWYRAAQACLALDKIENAYEACSRGLKIDMGNSALNELSVKIVERNEELEKNEKARHERSQEALKKNATLKMALKQRKIRTRSTPNPPDMEDTEIALAEPFDASSPLTFPVLLLYPLHNQTDFIKSFAETESLNDHLPYVLPPPFDIKDEYALETVECYMETAAGGLIKAGKKMSLGTILGSGKVEIVDGLVKVNVVPKNMSQRWIEEFKVRKMQH